MTGPGRAIYDGLGPHVLDFARRLTDILTPADRGAFDRAPQQITDWPAQLVAASAKRDDPMEDA